MSLLATVGRKSFKGRLFVLVVYAILVLLGTTMVVPFMISLSNSTTNNYDYERFRPVPRYFYSQTDRYVKGLVYFFNSFRGAMGQFRSYAPEIPATWTAWSAVGRDVEGDDAFARKYLDSFGKNREITKRMAADYSDFCDQYNLADMMVTVVNPQAIRFMEQYYITEVEKQDPAAIKLSYGKRRDMAIQLLSERWELPYETFFGLSFASELSAPVNFQGYFPVVTNPKYQDFIRLKQAYRSQVFTPGVKAKWIDFLKAKGYSYENEGFIFPVMKDSPAELKSLWRDFKSDVAPAAPCVPYALRASWIAFLSTDKAGRLLNLPENTVFSVDTYNTFGNTKYKTLEETPFPLPENAAPELKKTFAYFQRHNWPLRLTKVEVTPETQKLFSDFMKKEIKHIRIANQLFGTQVRDWNEFKLMPVPPQGEVTSERNYRGIWKNFVSQMPLKYRTLSSSETEFQKFVLKKYGSLENINKAYGKDYQSIEHVMPPFMEAYTCTFINNENAFTTTPIAENYTVIANYLLLNSNALMVTLILVAFAVFCTLTVNPLAAYAMSRFRIRGKDLIILFMLSTMAFPAMVSAIPAYLLMRDLGLLNTFAALILPGAANGMAIFILKGFFDSLPPELYEAATIDGASEFQIFCIVAMPMVKPILAINCLNAFIGAYNGWEWALIICQQQSMWTLAVWMYQATTWWGGLPWIVSAGFVVTSIPTLIVFVSCQKAILRGIVIPSMK